MHLIVKHKKPVIDSYDEHHSDDSLELITENPEVVKVSKRISLKKSAKEGSRKLNSGSSKCNKSKKNKQNVLTLMKTLREDDEAGNKAFSEKILVYDVFFFSKW